jgi:hypothetical protein
MSRKLIISFVIVLLACINVVEAFFPKSSILGIRRASVQKSFTQTFLTTSDFKNGLTLEVGKYRTEELMAQKPHLKFG